MSWEDRLQEAAFTSKSGKRIVYLYEDEKTNFEINGSSFNFIDADGTYIQRHGVTSDVFPERCFFSGEDHDLQAIDFLDAIKENGFGKLEHPIYGTRTVMVIGNVNRVDRLKTAANQSIIELTFYESIVNIYPATGGDLQAQVREAVEAANVAISDQMGDGLELSGSDATGKAAAKGFFERIFTAVSSSMGEIAVIQAETEEQLTEITGPVKDAFDNVQSSVGSVQTQFDAIHSSIITGLDRTIGEPVTLARQTLRLIQTPGRAFASVKEKLDRYRNVVDVIIAQGTATLSPGKNVERKNNFYISDMYASAALSGAVVAATSNVPNSVSIVSGEGLVQFQTRTQAVEAAEEILTMLDDITVWRDDNFESLDLVDTGEAYQAMYTIATLAASSLIDISFSLKQERTIVLDRARNIVELEAELYGTVDVNRNFLISANDLTGSEILELPRGREILYYV